MMAIIGIANTDGNIIAITEIMIVTIEIVIAITVIATITIMAIDTTVIAIMAIGITDVTTMFARQTPTLVITIETAIVIGTKITTTAAKLLAILFNGNLTKFPTSRHRLRAVSFLYAHAHSKIGI